MGSDGMLRHLAFFEELSRMDESDSNWRSVSAGLVVMRLIDTWIESASTQSPVDAWAMSSVREAIDQVPETTPVRRILTSVVDVMAASSPTDLHALVPRLMAYGKALEFEARWALAGDVYGTITQHVHATEDADVAVSAFLQLGICLRHLTHFDAAIAAYNKASEVALGVDDLVGVLRGRIGVAQVIGTRGNMPEADAILADTVERAAANGLDQVHSAALIDRAFIAGAGERYEQVISFSYEALKLANAQRMRDRILGNIATAFRYLGLYSAAQDAYVVLAATAEEQYVRWLAEINLLELAAFQGGELQFDRYRRTLDAADLSPDLRVTYLLHVGRGYHALGNSDAAIVHLERAIETASEHKLNQLLFEAEAALVDARRAARFKPPVVADVSPEVQTVVEAVHDMKELVGVE